MNKVSIYITVDTEWDRVKGQNNITVNNLKEIPVFQELCAQYAIKPVYFCAYEALKDTELCNYLLPCIRNKHTEIGAHLHPWTNPPFENYTNKSPRAFPNELPPELFKNKLTLLTETIESAFNIKPLTYRAGRFGLAPRHIPVLKALGYRIDSSVTPYINWSLTDKNAPDYSSIDNHYNEIAFENSTLTEYPVTIIRDKRISIKNSVAFILNKKRYSWLRIYPRTTFADMEYTINQAIKNQVYNLVFFMHSNELHHRCNTYFTTPEQVQKFYTVLEKLFEFTHRKGIKSKLFNEYK